MPRGGLPPELEHLTIWESYARGFREADIRDNTVGMATMWRQAYYTAFMQRDEIPPNLWPRNWMRQRTQHGTGVLTSDIGAWLNAMSQWSRQMMSSKYRR